MNQSSSAYVAVIGLKSVTLGGDDCLKYARPNYEYRRGCVINRFDSENEVNDFLQQCIDNQLLFSDDFKSNAYQEGSALVTAGILEGEVLAKPNFTGS